MNDKAMYLRLLGYLSPYRKRLIYGMIASVPAASLNGALAFAIGPFVDKLLREQNYTILTLIPVAILLATVIQGVCDYISTYYTSYVGTAISQDLRLELYEHLNKMDWRYMQSNSPGQMLGRYYSDPSRLQEAIVNNFQIFVLELFSFLSLAAVLISRSWLFAIISLFVISLLAFPIRIISRKLRVLDHENQQTMVSIYDVFYESVVGFKVINMFGLQRFQNKKFRQTLQEYFGNSMKLVRANAILKPIMQFIASIGISIIILFGGMQVQQGLMTPGDLTSFLLALVLLYKPVKNIGNIFSKVQRIFAPAERVFEKLDIEPNIVTLEDAVAVETFESLTFEDVHFAYEMDKPVLSDINLSVKAGEVVALVGESGGGKSTLVDLIPRFMDPRQGRILINGLDLRTLDLNSLRQLVALVSQDTILFNGTIRENIRLGRMTATEEEMDEAVSWANLQPMLAELPEGLDTVIGSRGIALSGGQRQRVAIARALLKNAPFIILDEATSALDNESEALVQNAMERVMRGKTVIVIAHRLSTIRNADRILVIDKGRIAEQGSHTELLAADGIYSNLYYLQFRHDPAYLDHMNKSALV